MGKKNKTTVHDIVQPIKTCKKCGDVKLINGFQPDKKGRLGVTDICNVCLSKEGPKQ